MIGGIYVHVLRVHLEYLSDDGGNRVGIRGIQEKMGAWVRKKIAPGYALKSHPDKKHASRMPENIGLIPKVRSKKMSLIHIYSRIVRISLPLSLQIRGARVRLHGGDVRRRLHRDGHLRRDRVLLPDAGGGVAPGARVRGAGLVAPVQWVVRVADDFLRGKNYYAECRVRKHGNHTVNGETSREEKVKETFFVMASIMDVHAGREKTMKCRLH